MNEVTVYKQIKGYLNIQYPELALLTHFDLSGVNNNSRYTRTLYAQLNERGYPDLFIAKPRISANGANYYGFYLEVKDEGVKVYKKDGSLRKNEHIEQQALRLAEFRATGYYANFAIGFDHAKEQIDAYFRQ